jgi:hypothetical protein
LLISLFATIELKAGIIIPKGMMRIIIFTIFGSTLINKKYIRGIAILTEEIIDIKVTNLLLIALILRAII